jgi:hypothetical protein
VTDEKKTADELREDAEKAKSGGSEQAAKLEKAADEQEKADKAEEEATKKE